MVVLGVHASRDEEVSHAHWLLMVLTWKSQSSPTGTARMVLSSWPPKEKWQLSEPHMTVPTLQMRTQRSK
jgi:hypothetical protein